MLLLRITLSLVVKYEHCCATHGHNATASELCHIPLLQTIWLDEVKVHHVKWKYDLVGDITFDLPSRGVGILRIVPSGVCELVLDSSMGFPVFILAAPQVFLASTTNFL
jgi:hypothetical protein